MRIVWSFLGSCFYQYLKRIPGPWTEDFPDFNVIQYSSNLVSSGAALGEDGFFETDLFPSNNSLNGCDEYFSRLDLVWKGET